MLHQHYMQGVHLKKNSPISIFFFSFKAAIATIRNIVRMSMLSCLRDALQDSFRSFNREILTWKRREKQTMDKTYEIGGKKFVLDENKAVQAYQEKKVINGRETMTFNLLPLKYQWAYDLYRKMKSNHWEPEDIPMQKDLEQWKNPAELSDSERWIIMMGIGYFSAALS